VKSLLLKNRFFLGTLGVILLTLGGFALSLYTHYEEEVSDQHVLHSHHVIRRANDILLLTTDAETGTRGYILTGDTALLDPYHRLRRTLSLRVDSLQQLLPDNPEQLAQMDSLRPMLAARRQIFDQVVDLRARNQPVPIPLIMQGKFKSYLIRQRLLGMIDAEERLLIKRNQNADQMFVYTNILSVLLLLLTFITLVVNYYQMRTELDRRERNERQLLSYELSLQAKITELERSNQDLLRFAYVASHDLQEPLRKIQTFATMLTGSLAGEVSDSARSYLVRIERAAHRSSTLVQDLLTYSRMSNRAEAFQPVNLQQVVEEVREELELSIAESQASILTSNLPSLEAMPGQMLHLFRNLVSNSLKYRRPNIAPEIRIEAEVLANTESREAVYRIEIIDNGLGFEDKHAEQIFEPFKRLHANTDCQGTGIGLAICKRVVLRHGGTISASSTPGQGTCIRILLPQRQQEVMAARPDPLPAAA